jgi:hypothetical protein
MPVASALATIDKILPWLEFHFCAVALVIGLEYVMHIGIVVAAVRASGRLRSALFWVFVALLVFEVNIVVRDGLQLMPARE